MVSLLLWSKQRYFKRAWKALPKREKEVTLDGIKIKGGKTSKKNILQGFNVEFWGNRQQKDIKSKWVEIKKEME